MFESPLILLLSDLPLQLDIFHLLYYTRQNLEPIQSYKPIPTSVIFTQQVTKESAKTNWHQKPMSNLTPTQKSADP